jgi:hypothetical protein
LPNETTISEVTSGPPCAALQLLTYSTEIFFESL